jgi:hypothetical protein
MSGQATRIRKPMEVVGGDGRPVRRVDNAEGDRIKRMTRGDPDRSGRHRHGIPCGAVASVEGP